MKSIYGWIALATIAAEMAWCEGSLSVTWDRLQLSRRRDGNYRGISNNYDVHKKYSRWVKFDLCGPTVRRAYKRPQFHLHFSNGDTKVISDCNYVWFSPHDGDFNVTVRLIDTGETQHVEFWVKNIWMVIMGDSWASGMGMPIKNCVDFTRIPPIMPAQYINEPVHPFPGIPWGNPNKPFNKCYRSPKAFSFLIYKRILKKYKYRKVGVQLTFLACGNAIIENVRGDQLSVVRKIRRGVTNDCPQCPNAPTLFIMSAGGNDLGFAWSMIFTFSGFLWLEKHLPVAFNVQGHPFKAAPKERVKMLERRLHRLGEKFKKMSIKPETVFYAGIYSLVQDEHGNPKGVCSTWNENLPSMPIPNWIPVLPKFGAFPFSPFWALQQDADFKRLLYDFGIPIRIAMHKKAKQLGWNFLDAFPVFEKHGICSKNSYYPDWLESLMSDCNAFYAGLHPHEKGHKKTAQYFWPQITKYLDGKEDDGSLFPGALSAL